MSSFIKLQKTFLIIISNERTFLIFCGLQSSIETSGFLTISFRISWTSVTPIKLITELQTPNKSARSVSFSTRISNPLNVNLWSVIFLNLWDDPGLCCGAMSTRVDVSRLSHACSLQLNQFRNDGSIFLINYSTCIFRKQQGVKIL